MEVEKESQSRVRLAPLRHQPGRGQCPPAGEVAKPSSVRQDAGPGHLLLLLVDFLFAQTVINLLSTAAWRGVWNLWDLYLYGGADLGLEVQGLFQVILKIVLVSCSDLGFGEISVLVTFKFW